MNLTANDSTTVDVGFAAEQTTNATVEWVDDSGTVINSTTLEFDPIDFADGTGVLTAEFEPSSDYNNTDIRVTTSPASGYDGVFVLGNGSGTVAGGGLFGASSTQLMGFFVVLAVALLAARSGVFD